MNPQRRDKTQRDVASCRCTMDLTRHETCFHATWSSSSGGTWRQTVGYRIPITAPIWKSYEKTSGQICPVSFLDRCLWFFVHVARPDERVDHIGVLRSVEHIRHWRRAIRGRQWSRAIEKDLGLNTAWRRAQDRQNWREVVETATLQHGACLWVWWWLVLQKHDTDLTAVYKL